MIGAFSAIQTIDLYLAGDPGTGYIRALYRINGGTVKGDGSGQTIAIVDAYHDANIFLDVNTFDTRTSTTPGVDASAQCRRP